MKKRVLLLLVALCGMSAFAASFKNGETVYVSAKSVQLKSTDGTFSGNAGLAVYGDSGKVLAVSGKKVKVQLSTGSKSTGWIATGSLTKKKINKSSKTTASASELALAGKGFSEEAENAYKASNSKLDFKAVDAIEAIRVSDSELQKFIADGHLKQGD